MTVGSIRSGLLTLRISPIVPIFVSYFIVLSVRASWISSLCMLLVAWICFLELVQFPPFSYMGSVLMVVVRRALAMSAPSRFSCCLVLLFGVVQVVVPCFLC